MSEQSSDASIIPKWLPIKGFEGYYEVSNFGRVRSLIRIVKRKTTGDIFKLGEYLTPTITRKGYLRLQLAKDGKKNNYLIHRLVAQQFILNPENKPEVNHLNGIKTDNYVLNLQWATETENQQHAYDTGLKVATVKYVVKCNELNIITKGIDKMVLELRQLGYSANSGPIWKCITGNAYSHLGLTFKEITDDTNT